jgi:hypothetical protein
LHRFAIYLHRGLVVPVRDPAGFIYQDFSYEIFLSFDRRRKLVLSTCAVTASAGFSLITLAAAKFRRQAS